jgi:6-phosphogluconolactonase (cycloisomerase 2 family)
MASGQGFCLQLEQEGTAMAPNQRTRINARPPAGTLRRGIWTVCALAIATSAAFGQATMKAAFVGNDGNTEGSVTSFVFDANGAPVFVQKVVTGGDDTPGTNAYTISITPNGRYLATGHATAYAAEQITILEVAADATMTIIHEHPGHPGTPLDLEWINDRYLAVTRTELGETNEVIVYEFDPIALTLTEVDRGTCGTFTSSVAVHPSGEYLYAGDSFAYRIYPFQIHADGTLTPLASISTGTTYPLAVRVSPDGTKLYANGGISSGGHAVLGYHIAPDGTLSPMAGSPFYSPGDSPKDCVCSGDSTILFAGHGSDASARSFLIDSETGQLTATGYFFYVGIQGSLGDVEVLGDYLLITDNWDGPTGLYSFDILPNGSFTINGGLVSSQGIGPREIAVWVPPCIGDVNGDGIVDLSDLATLLSSYGFCEGDSQYVAEADLDDDDCVGLSDLALLLANYGRICP